ncbi:chromosome transmission fidelity protein 18 homolog [Montipora capricornis]|uniref:chromosome transmission fidelity protein 18 homolog n=1 Tax=Montipora capricornis TaxID=246305 RepID=UPI0035F1C40F
MDIWDIQEQDEFESRYADELEMLDGLEEEESTPVSKRSLNFDREKTADNGMTGNGVPMNQNRVKKRDCNEMSVLLSDVEESILDDSDFVSGPCKKRARLSPLQNSKDHDVSRQLPKPGCVKSPLRQLQSSPLQSHDSTSIDRKILSNPERFKVFRRPPMSCEAVSITRMDGQRLYLSIKADKEVSVKAKGLNRTLFRGGTSLQLLSMPFSVLQEHVQDERRRRVMEESEKLTASLNSMLNENSDVAEVEHMLHFNGTEINKEEEKLAQYALWVEKYTPRYFTELLSDDAINRTLLKWLKLWDKVVFGKGQDKENKGRPEQTKKPKPNFAKNYKKQGSGVQEEGDWKEIDVTGRPVYKVALLCGPPGLGKTTLAHVIARHAGYNVVEMNASDDRSQEIFRNTLEASTQMKSVLGHNEKPNCLVIDEIDGAPAPAINVLLSVIKQKESGQVEIERTDDVAKVDIVTAIRTDHSAITLEIDSLDDQQRGPSFWKFNNNLLDDALFVQRLCENFPIWLDEMSFCVDLRIKWDWIKFKICEESISFSKLKAQERRRKIQTIENRLKICEERITQSPTQENLANLESAKAEYEKEYDCITPNILAELGYIFVPFVPENAVFVIQRSALKHRDDWLVTHLGSFDNEGQSGRVFKVEGEEVISTKQWPRRVEERFRLEDDEYLVLSTCWRHAKYKDFSRITTVVSQKHNKELDLVLVQYYFQGNEHHISPKKHPRSQRPFIPTASRTRNSIVEKLKKPMGPSAI